MKYISRKMTKKYVHRYTEGFTQNWKDALVTTLIHYTGKCICRVAGIYAYCRYFIDRKW